MLGEACLLEYTPLAPSNSDYRTYVKHDPDDLLQINRVLVYTI
jgi:hypothetical protein